MRRKRSGHETFRKQMLGTLNLETFEWIDLFSLEMQLVKLNFYSVSQLKSNDFRLQLETVHQDCLTNLKLKNADDRTAENMKCYSVNF
jgi:hypothetical protein